ncbi:bacillithiol system redox-active protein YtxJ [Gracilimonas sp. Q87]|uniref:bacillithiol system redox-active protein YtxJ n=1 Tax=Gracilimonas sp. Q87 TaxID=3384766 RepID=UPI0039841923
MNKTKVQNVKNWNVIPGKETLNSLLDRSKMHPQVIYKHSSRCSVSYLTKEELEHHMDLLSNRANMHFINVIEQRELSNYLAERLNIRHESPQVLLLKDGRVTWNASHWNIKGKEILSNLV